MFQFVYLHQFNTKENPRPWRDHQWLQELEKWWWGGYASPWLTLSSFFFHLSISFSNKPLLSSSLSTCFGFLGLYPKLKHIFLFAYTLGEAKEDLSSLLTCFLLHRGWRYHFLLVSFFFCFFFSFFPFSKFF